MLALRLALMCAGDIHLGLVAWDWCKVVVVAY